MSNSFWKNAWWLSRVTVGGILHLTLIVCALFNIEVTYEVVKTAYESHIEQDIIKVFSPSFVAIIATISMFTASMAGVFWVKQMYIQHFLPELIEDLFKKINQ